MFQLFVTHLKLGSADKTRLSKQGVSVIVALGYGKALSRNCSAPLSATVAGFDRSDPAGEGRRLVFVSTRRRLTRDDRNTACQSL
jgi:hypothetical protein